MGTEVFLKFFVSHLETMILASAFVVVLLIIALVLLGLREPGPEAVSATGNLSELEGLMRKMLDSAQLHRVPMPMPSVVADEEASSSKAKTSVVREVDTAALDGIKAELQSTKSTLAEKDSMIAKLKSSLELAQSDQSKKAGPTQQMQDKIKELEAKLAEYEIIEDDIADLTMYKEENTQLKNQIKELMKNGGVAPVAAPAPATPAAPVAAAPATETAISDDVLEEFKRAVEGQKEATAAVAPAPAPTPAPAPAAPPAPEPVAAAPAPASVIDDDLMSEFAAALADQKAAPAAGKSQGMTSPIPTAIPTESEGPFTQDIMEEFMNVAAVDEESAPAEVPKDSALNEVTDTDKMVQELQGIDSSTQGGQANLDEIDTDKMLSEASELDKDSGNQKS